MKNKLSFQFGFVACLMAASALSGTAATPIHQYYFEEPGSTFATNSGSSSVLIPLEMLKNGLWNDSHGPGVAGYGLDQRFVDGSTSGEAQHTTGQNAVTVDDNNLDNFVSFTLM